MLWKKAVKITENVLLACLRKNLYTKSVKANYFMKSIYFIKENIFQSQSIILKLKTQMYLQKKKSTNS